MLINLFIIAIVPARIGNRRWEGEESWGAERIGMGLNKRATSQPQGRILKAKLKDQKKGI